MLTKPWHRTLSHWNIFFCNYWMIRDAIRVRTLLADRRAHHLELMLWVSSIPLEGERDFLCRHRLAPLQHTLGKGARFSLSTRQSCSTPVYPWKGNETFFVDTIHMSLFLICQRYYDGFQPHRILHLSPRVITDEWGVLWRSFSKREKNQSEDLYSNSTNFSLLLLSQSNIA